MDFKKHSYDSTLLSSFTASPRVSNLRKSIIHRPRTSLVPRYYIALNSSENTSVNAVDELDQNEALESVLNNPLSNVCRVSPLHRFNYDRIKFKQYALKIKQHIAANVKSNFNITYSVEINVIENLKTERQHSDAIKITVCGSKNDDDDKFMYRGVFFSWGNISDNEEPNFTHLPLLLDFGQAKVATCVREMMMKLFDCVITPLSFTQSQLLLFSVMVSKIDSSQGAKPVTFTYLVPRTKYFTKIEISMEADEMRKFMTRCCKSDNISVEQELYHYFREHVRTCYHFDVALLELTQLNFPNIRLQSKGNLKLSDLTTAKMVLKILANMTAILEGPLDKLELSQ